MTGGWLPGVLHIITVVFRKSSFLVICTVVHSLVRSLSPGVAVSCLAIAKTVQRARWRVVRSDSTHLRAGDESGVGMKPLLPRLACSHVPVRLFSLTSHRDKPRKIKPSYVARLPPLDPRDITERLVGGSASTSPALLACSPSTKHRWRSRRDRARPWLECGPAQAPPDRHRGASLSLAARHHVDRVPSPGEELRIARRPA
jgi:hypothetical protein